MDVVPRRHASIGLDAYAQVTSPIRRYPDLLAAFQIKAFLRGDSLPFSSWDILQYRSTYEAATRQAEGLQSSSVRYWILRHIERNPDTLSQRLRCVILPQFSSSSSAGGSNPWSVVRRGSLIEQRPVAGDLVQGREETALRVCVCFTVCLVFLLDLGMRCYMKLSRPHDYGVEMRVDVQRVNSLHLELDLRQSDE